MVIPAIPSVYSRGSDFPQQWEGTEQAAAFSSMQKDCQTETKEKAKKSNRLPEISTSALSLETVTSQPSETRHDNMHLIPESPLAISSQEGLIPTTLKLSTQRTQKIHILRCSSKLQWRVCKDTRTCVSGPTSLCLGCIFLSMEVTWGYGEPRWWLKPPHGAYFEHK